ncbi:MAG: GNAT family N-acetyltransferase [Bacteroidota bacterium]
MVQLTRLDRYNWESCLSISLLPEQETYVPSILFSLAQASFEAVKPLGIMYRGKMIGLLIHGEFSGICWISRILIDKDYQGRGLGTEAIQQMIKRLAIHPSCREIRTSYVKENQAAQAFFEKLGFEPIPGEIGQEVVAVYVGE